MKREGEAGAEYDGEGDTDDEADESSSVDSRHEQQANSTATANNSTAAAQQTVPVNHTAAPTNTATAAVAPAAAVAAANSTATAAAAAHKPAKTQPSGTGTVSDALKRRDIVLDEKRLKEREALLGVSFAEQLDLPPPDVTLMPHSGMPANAAGFLKSIHRPAMQAPAVTSNPPQTYTMEAPTNFQNPPTIMDLYSYWQLNQEATYATGKTPATRTEADMWTALGPLVYNDHRPFPNLPFDFRYVERTLKFNSPNTPFSNVVASGYLHYNTHASPNHIPSHVQANPVGLFSHSQPLVISHPLYHSAAHKWLQNKLEHTTAEQP